MQTSIAAITENVLECNPLNRVAVVQYSQTGSTPRIYIEGTGFSNTAIAFIRRYNESGNAPASLELIADALNGIINPAANVTSPQKTLTRTPGNALAVYFFTDAPRTGDLVDSFPVGDPNAFTSYTNFKNNFNATFIVTIIPDGTVGTVQYNQSRDAAAAIASDGGSYLGPIEIYTGNPDGSSVPRLMLEKNTFLLTQQEIEIITDDICSVVELDCPTNLVLTSANNVASFIQDNRQADISITASNVFSADAVGVYRAGTTIALKPGFHTVSSSRFRGYIEECSDIFAGRPASVDEANRSLNFESSQKRFITLSPNPANSIVTVTTDRVMLNITITSLEGKLMYSRDVKGNNHDINVSTYAKGYYTVTITTEDGEITSEKLIKD